MIDLSGVNHHPAIEEIVDVLCHRTHAVDRGFFRAQMAYYLAKVASSMRTFVTTKDRGDFPVNVYALCLAPSGYGKGHSIEIIENQLLGGFTQRFVNETLPVVSENNFWNLANERALRNNTNQQEEYDAVVKEYRNAGGFLHDFDSSTSAALKQLRQKFILAGCGALNFQMDEVGSNLNKEQETMKVFLELYDQGRVKNSLRKSSNDNARAEEVMGKTPANMLLFGTPAAVFDGGQTEDLFYQFLEIGYARRCIFGFGLRDLALSHTRPVEEIYQELIDPQKNENALKKWSKYFHQLADPALVGLKIRVDDTVGIELLAYKMWCEKRSAAMRESQQIQKSEMEHRSSKALKLAGALAFVDRSNEVEMDHLKSAILLIEESGSNFAKILTREKPHVRLGKYLADVGVEVTENDLLTDCPFYKGSKPHRTDMMTLATAWGYANNVVIKKTFGPNNIEFYRGETLKKTDLSSLIVSGSAHWAYNYEPGELAFDQLQELATEPELNWCNHHFRNEHRTKENTIPGFNMLVFDVDGGIRREVVHDLLKGITHFTYTTKRHTEENHRFRVLIPTNYVLELDDDDYKKLVNDVITWLPFKPSEGENGVDSGSNQRSKKWLSFEGAQCYLNLAEDLFDILPFIPNTERNDNYRKEYKAVANMDNLERWFASKMVAGDRNNQMIKYALALVDTGMDLQQVRTQVHAFNGKLSEPLSEIELDSTIMVTVARKLQAKAA